MVTFGKKCFQLCKINELQWINGWFDCKRTPQYGELYGRMP